MPRIKLFLLFLALSLAHWTHAQSEGISLYDVHVKIRNDASLIVTENITVQAEHIRIKHGITRSLPTQRMLKGKTRSMQYDIISVMRDGQEEPYYIRESGGMKTLFIGRQNYSLEPGRYTYTIKYKVPRQIALYKSYDQLTWNAVGTEGKFEVEKASCTVVLPAGARMMKRSCFVGEYGSTNEDCIGPQSSEGQCEFETTTTLSPYQGFTVRVRFSKGTIPEAGFWETSGVALLLFLASCALGVYYYVSWKEFGVDPPQPVSNLSFEPPVGHSAASINFLRQGGYSDTSVTAGLIQLAAKGYVEIEIIEKEKGEKKYKINNLFKDPSVLSAEEKQLLKSLLRKEKSILLGGNYNPFVANAFRRHQEILEGKHTDFLKEGNNQQKLWAPATGGIMIWFFAMFMVSTGSEGRGLSDMMNDMGLNVWALFLFPIFMIVSLIIYSQVIKKPSVEKLQLLAEIEGFKRYLEMPKEERLRLSHAPAQTPEHFDELLAYAIALKVENEWRASFGEILSQAAYKSHRTNELFDGEYPFETHFFSVLRAGTIQPMESGSGGDDGGGFSGGGGGGGFSGGGGGGGGVGGW